VTGPLALVGSGEYLPVMLDVERLLLDGRPERYVQLATAAAPEGPASVERWHRLGREQAQRLGVEAVQPPVVDAASAADEANAAQVAGAGLVYLSGGNPGYLADALRGSATWEAILHAWRGGAALAGCSAGAIALTGWVPSLRHPRRGAVDGLNLLPHLRVIPHFDKMLGWMPDIVQRTLLQAPHGTTVVGIDEDTALVGGPHEWQVHGRQSVHVLSDASRRLDAGETLST
jgi:cyanophycinase